TLVAVGDEPAAVEVTAAPRPEPPARPGKESALASPLVEFETPRPPWLNVSVGVWILSCVVGFLIIGYFVYRLDGVRTLLETAMLEEDPAVDASALNRAVDATIAIAIGLMAVLVAIKLWLTIVMAARRNWARVLLTIVSIVGVPVPAISATLLTVGTVEDRAWMLSAIIAQEALVLIGLVTMYLPAPNSWFRHRLRR
ncbi:MAG: hypothetical protein ACRDZ2_00355, partial [Ilumatobacteraceae bacterium]